MAEVDDAQRELTTYRLEENGQVVLHISHRAVSNTNLCILGVHGYSEHGARYAHFARYLANQNAESFWLDLPGHGQSGGRRADIGSIEEYTEAFERFYRDVRKKRPHARIHLFAHSLGGLVALRWLQTRAEDPQVFSLSLSCPLLGIQRFSGWKINILWILTTILPNFTLPNESELGASCLTHDRDFEESRKKDPLIKPQVTVNWVRSFLRVKDKVFAEIDRLKTPTAIFQAELEMVTHREEAERFFKELKVEKEYKVYPKIYHELLNETNREEVMRDIWNWISAHEPRHF